MSMITNIIDAKSHHDLPITGRTVSRLALDYRLALQFLEPNYEFQIVIASSFMLTSVNGTFESDPEHPDTLAPALLLLRKLVTSARAYGDGTLVVEFGDDSRLTVPPDVDFEAWETVCSDTSKFVSLPGGGLAVWEARP